MLLIAGWLFLACILFIICNPAPLYFLNDDFIYISSSPALNYLYRTAFRPVSDLSLLLDYTVYGKQGWGYHVSNFIFHCISTVMVGLIAKRMLAFLPAQMRSDWIPHIAASLFFCYPFHSESIFWIIGRGGSLVTIFFLAAFWFSLSPIANFKTWFLSWLFFVLGLLVYESSWLMPVAMILALLLRKSHGLVIRKVDYIGISVVLVTLLVSFYIRHKYINDFFGSPYLNTIHFELGIKQLLYNYATGFMRSFLPPMASSIVFATISIALLLGLFTMALLLLKRRKTLAVQIVLLVIFLITLSPIAILGVNTHTSESERFLYLPSAFFCLLLVFILPSILSHKKLKATYSIIIIVSCLFLYRSAVVYRIASSWTSTSILAISKHPGKYNIIHLYQLPTQYKGGFIFRLGFEDAIKWICPEVKYDIIQVHSTQELIYPVRLSIASEQHKMDRSITNSEERDLNIYWSADSISIIKTSVK